MEKLDYADDKMLQALACQCHPFTKTDILNTARRLRLVMQSSAPFITKYSKAGVLSEMESYHGVPEYIISFDVWPEIIRAVKPENFKKAVKMGGEIGRTHEVAFAQAVNAFLYGRDYADFLKEVGKAGLFHSGRNIKELAVSLKSNEELWPFLKSLPHDYMLVICDSYEEMLLGLDFTDKDLRGMQCLVSDNKSVPKQIRQRLEDATGFYVDFVKRGDLKKAQKTCVPDNVFGICLNAVEQLQKSDFDGAAKTFLSGMRGTGHKDFNEAILNFYYGIALANSSLRMAQTRISALFKTDSFGEGQTAALRLLLLIAKGQKKNIDALKYYNRCYTLPQKAIVALIIKHYRLSGVSGFGSLMDTIDERNISLFQMEMSADVERYVPRREGLERLTGLHPTLPPYVEIDEWEVKLDELIRLSDKGNNGKTSTAKSAQRIIYMVDLHGFSIQPKLQKSKDGINWTSGRNVALEKLMKGTAEGMTDEDRRVGACVDIYDDGWYGQTSLELSGPKAMAALVGNPNVFNAQTGTHLDVVEERPVLTVGKSGDDYKVTTDIDPAAIRNGWCAIVCDRQKVKVVRVDANMKKTIETLNGMKFPQKATDKLTTLLGLLSGSMVVMSDLLKGSESAATKPSHPETVVQLQPAGETVACRLLVRPFGKIPPVCRPGKGMQVITTTIDGKQVQTKRNLKKEAENYALVEQLMVDFEDDGGNGGSWSLSAEECLTLLEQLRELKDHCVVEWPEGERMKVVRNRLTPQDFSVSVTGVANWFELSGDIQVSPGKKMKIAELVEKLSLSKGNFIQLSDTEYVRITAELRRHIDLLGRIATVNRGKMRVSQFNAPLLEELGDSGMELTADKAYTDMIDRISGAQAAEIKIPKTINADLRSYQKDGYLWMARLAQWGAGALLADDMGLGKTLQAITLLLSRARMGAQLVVVPTSLIMNWRDETARFAPSLSVRILNSQGEDRAAVIRDAKEFDVVVTTYGLLINEEEQLCSKQWATIVLDEAHTIKNRETKMSQAAMKLKGDFRLLLTGTPLQNHVSEMWNLMQFANPDLLGSYPDFCNRFLTPIERDHDKERQRQLKSVITPFILRRTKSDVLNELPEKTEITLKVDLSEDEWAFYDNIRQKALAGIESSAVTAVQALAEITRLRQAACNVQLVEKGLSIPSSKMERFMQLVDELHSNHHRALVFSQFTSHLALVRQRLDEAGVSYLYLDGTTPAKDRIRLVDEFRQGDMPLFLISLKAGGLGLNLTAADYVVHLDPWWNPAIEDQASDRAYRIGQQKPVTVYRLIVSGTIEEKIVALHQTKKNMADALLEGGDVSASMTRDEMVELLRANR